MLEDNTQVIETHDEVKEFTPKALLAVMSSLFAQQNKAVNEDTGGPILLESAHVAGDQIAHAIKRGLQDQEMHPELFLSLLHHSAVVVAIINAHNGGALIETRLLPYDPDDTHPNPKQQVN